MVMPGTMFDPFQSLAVKCNRYSGTYNSPSLCIHHIRRNRYVCLIRLFNATCRHSFAEIERNGLEGVMAKRLDSAYSPGRRLPDWLKIKVATYLHRTARYKERSGAALP